MRTVHLILVVLSSVFVVICLENPQSDEVQWSDIRMPKTSYFGGEWIKMHLSTACDSLSHMTIGRVR